MFRKLIPLLLFVAMSLIGFSQNSLKKYVYRLTIVRNDGKTIIQSGFKLKGRAGIITALHGVVNYSSISANNEFVDKPIRNLEIIRADIFHDIAIINNESSPNLIPVSDGIVKAEREPRLDEAVTTLSYPLGVLKPFVRYASKSGAIYLREREQLINRIGVNSTKLIQRGSPDTRQELFILTGPLTPGESGGAILNGDNEVFAVIDGGNGGINWAIPINIIGSKVISNDQAALSKLSTTNSEELFSSVLFKQNNQLVSSRTAKIKPIVSTIPSNSINNCFTIKQFDDGIMSFRSRPLSTLETDACNLCHSTIWRDSETNEVVKKTYPDNSNHCRLKQEIDQETYLDALDTEVVKLLKQEGKWYKIKVISTGQIGYVAYKFKGQSVLNAVDCN